MWIPIDDEGHWRMVSVEVTGLVVTYDPMMRPPLATDGLPDHIVALRRGLDTLSSEWTHKFFPFSKKLTDSYPQSGFYILRMMVSVLRNAKQTFEQVRNSIHWSEMAQLWHGTHSVMLYTLIALDA